MLATRRGVALIRRASPEPANDNVPGSFAPDDRLFLPALALICAGIAALFVYVLMSGPEDVMLVLRR